MELYDYLEKYRDIDKEIIHDDKYFSFESSIFHKKEFYENKLKQFEKKPDKKGKLLSHQKIISNFLSSYTPYNELLLFHEPGTGKTCTSISVIERIRKEDKNIDGAVIITRGENLKEQFLDQLIFDCTEGQYIPEKYDEIKDQRIKKKLKKDKVKDFYEFYTFYQFAKKVKSMSDEDKIKNYSNKVIVIDEVHNIKGDKEEKEEKEEKGEKAESKQEAKLISKSRTNPDINVYNIIHYLLHIISNRKILLMSGTPMSDQPEEIADIMNLILPLKEQLPTGKDFEKRYLTVETGKNASERTIKIKKSRIEELTNALKGRISYLKFMKSDVKNEYIGELNNGMNYFKTEKTFMEEHQSSVYDKTIVGKEEGKGVYLDSRQASLFVYPDKSYGSNGFLQNFKESDKDSLGYTLSPKIINLFKDKTTEEKLKELEKYSAKYAYIIRHLLDEKNKGKLAFVYCSFVEGSGSVIFCKMLEIFGFTQSKGENITSTSKERNSYSIITGKTTKKEVDKILATYNNKENRFGKYIKVLIGSEAISEGINLKNVQDIFVLTPFWNFTETFQAISRGIRTYSHLDLGDDVMVKIYLLCAISKSGVDKSIDLIMYKKSEIKDKNIKAIERIIKECSFDCGLNYERNASDVDYSRDCEYQLCDYKCTGLEDLYDLDEQDNEDYNYFILQENKLDFSSYLFRYTDTYKKYVFDSITSLFLVSDFIDLNQIIEEVIRIIRREYRKEKKEIQIKNKKIITKVILLYLTDIIESATTFTDKDGNIGYISQEENILFLSKDLDYKNRGYMEYFYKENNYLKESLDMETLLDKEYKNTHAISVIDNMLKTKKYDNITMLSSVSKELLFEYCFLAKKKDKTKNKSFVDFVYNYFNNFLTELSSMEGYFVSSILYTEFKSLRCINMNVDSDNLEWVDCDKKIEEKWLEEIEILKQQKKSKYGISGIETKKGEFKIKYDDKERYTGKTCSSYNMIDLLPIIDKIKLEPMIKQGKLNPFTEEILINASFIKGYSNLKNMLKVFDIDESKLLSYNKYKDAKDTKSNLEKLIEKDTVYISDKIFGEEKDYEKIKKDSDKVKYFKRELANVIIKTRPEKDVLKKYEKLVMTFFVDKKVKKESEKIQKIVDSNILDLLRVTFWSRKTKVKACVKIKSLFKEEKIISFE